jgi:hypothetical protein
MEWWRCKHGAPADPKWRAIGARVNVAPGVVWAVFSALCDRASQAEDRGSIAGADPEDIAAVFGFDVGEVERTVKALTAKGVIVGERIANWNRHQPKTEDVTAAARKRAQRARHVRHAMSRDVTDGHDASRTVTADKSREDKKEEEDTQSVVESVGSRSRANRTPSKATRWPSDAIVPQDWIVDAACARQRHGLPVIDLRLEAESFANYWAAASGRNASKHDWKKTWINWSTKAHGNRKPPGDNFFGNLADRLGGKT